MGCAVLKVPSDDALDPLSAALRLQASCINLLRDPYTLAGMGTVGLEILRQAKDPRQLEAIFCSARSGGALEAIGLSVKQFAPQVKVVGVDIICAANSSEINGILCDSSIADQQLKLLSSLTVVHENRHAHDHDDGDEDLKRDGIQANAEVIDEIIMVEPLEIQTAVRDTFRETRGIVDINGALAVAGMMKYASQGSKETSRALVAVISSAEVELEDLKNVLF
jgi:threonine dehydratase